MKQEFEFQYYYRRLLGSLSCLLIAIALRFPLDELPVKQFVRNILGFAILFLLLIAYYVLSEKWKWFYDTGCYWVESDDVHIEMGKKDYTIIDITELLGDTKSVYGSQYAILLIETKTEKVKLFSPPMEPGKGFEASSLYPIYQLLLGRASGLEPVKVLDREAAYWYRVR